MLKKILVAFAAAALTFMAVTPASAIGLGASRDIGNMRAFQPRAGKPAPLAFQLFCLRYRSECKASRTSEIPYTTKLQATLASVNRSVNRSIIPLNERRDVWSLNPRFGDCDDYVMTKRSRLIRAGVPAGALRVAVVKTRSGEGHAVLIVKTSAGEYVLDNIRKQLT
jgi:predicted transglutaminase-like cysteine proteinase